MRQPQGFVQPGQEDRVCLLKKSLSLSNPSEI
jgi:hypothetical protein